MSSRAAIIDMGSNAIRLYIGELTSDNKLKEIVYKRATVKLANDSFRSGKISTKSITSVKKVFSEFRDIALSHECNQIKAVATSALRDAENANDLIRDVFLETSIMIELITGEFEAELVAKSVLNKIDDESFILADLGGGSLEIVLIHNKEIYNKRSFQIGNLRFAQLISQCETNTEKIEQLQELFHVFSPEIGLYTESLHQAKLVITGGNSNFIARILSGKPTLNETYALSNSTLLEFFNSISQKDEETLIKTMNMRRDRVQTLLPSLFIFCELSKLTQSSEILVPFTGLREGLVYHLFETV